MGIDNDGARRLFARIGHLPARIVMGQKMRWHLRHGDVAILNRLIPRKGGGWFGRSGRGAGGKAEQGEDGQGPEQQAGCDHVGSLWQKTGSGTVKHTDTKMRSR